MFHLRPNSRTYNDWLGLGLTIVDSLDVLIIMNLKNGNIAIFSLHSFKFFVDFNILFFNLKIPIDHC